MSPLTFGMGKTHSTLKFIAGKSYSITTGTKSLIFGNNGSTRMTATSITNNLLGAGSLTSSTTPSAGSNDDGWWTLSLPWNVFFGETLYNTVYVGTNSYITFGGGSSSLSPSATDPAFDKIVMDGADNSAQRIYYGVEGTAPNRTYRIRYEGTSSTSGTLGSPNMVWEATFYENNIYQIDIQTGTLARANGYSGAGTASALLAGGASTLGTSNKGTRLTMTTPSAFQNPWTVLQNASADDVNAIISLPFTFYLAGTGYTSAYLCSNTFFTFGTSFTGYSGLGGSYPACDKIFLGSADNSYQRIFTYNYGTDYKTIRYEGTASTSGTLNAPNIVLEITFFNPAAMGGKNVIELLVGQHGRTSGAFGIASASAYYASSTIAANTSYVFEGNSTGTSWTLTSNKYVTS